MSPATTQSCGKATRNVASAASSWATQRKPIMRKEIRAIDEKTGVVRITTSDERWYAKPVYKEDSGLPEFKVLPSVTWILSVYPKLGLMRLRDEVGADEMELMKRLGGERGSKVHEAISSIIEGNEVRIDSKFINPNTGLEEELTAEEIRHVMSFVQWKNEVKPRFIIWDKNIYSEKHGYAGTLDAIAEINGEFFLIDFKTSKVITTEYAMQVASYREAIVNGENVFDELDEALRVVDEFGKVSARPLNLAILQLGQKPLKTIPSEYRWKVTENNFDLFLATRQIWAEVYATQIADYRGFSQKDYPIVLSPKTNNLVELDGETITMDADVIDKGVFTINAIGENKPKKGKKMTKKA